MVKAQFISPMLLLKTDSLPDSDRWRYQLKLDGYRTIAFKSGGQRTRWSGSLIRLGTPGWTSS